MNKKTMKHFIPKTKKELIKIINLFCEDERLDLERKVWVNELWNGYNMTKQYACAVSKNKYYIHFTSWCSCGGARYDVGETLPYPLKELDADRLTALLKALYRDYEWDDAPTSAEELKNYKTQNKQ